MSTGYNAGLDSSDVVVSYGEEVTWNTLPAVQFKQLRLLSESLSETKTRTRPAEINNLGYAAHALTTQVEAGGALNFGLSSGTYDDMLGGLVNGSFGTPLAINGITTDLAAVSGTGRITSTLSGKFDAIEPGQWIKMSGWANAANNGFFRVTARTTGASPYIEVANGTTTLVSETAPSGAVQIRGTMLRNGTSIRTFYVQKKMASNIFLRYGGGYITGGSLNAQVGNFLEGNFNYLFSQETKSTSDASTGAVSAAPAGRVIDTVSGISSIQVADTAIAAAVQGMSLNVTKENARVQRGIGSAAARGIGRGTLNLNGKLSVYFLNFDYYDMYKAETDQLISFRALDDQGAGYIITLPAVTLVNPAIVAGGPDTDLVADFDLEGNVPTSGVYANVLIQIDKF